IGKYCSFRENAMGISEQISVTNKKAGRSPLFLSCDVTCNLHSRRALAFLDSLHRQADAALLVDFQHLDLDDVAFLELVGDLLDALVGDLGDVDQAVLAGGDGDEGAEV